MTSSPTTSQIRRLARRIIGLLPDGVLAASQVTCILYDERVVLIGLTIRTASQPKVREALLSAQPLLAQLLCRPVGVKHVSQGALVVAPLQPKRMERHVTAPAN